MTRAQRSNHSAEMDCGGASHEIAAERKMANQARANPGLIGSGVEPRPRPNRVRGGGLIGAGDPGLIGAAKRHSKDTKKDTTIDRVHATRGTQGQIATSFVNAALMTRTATNEPDRPSICSNGPIGAVDDQWGETLTSTRMPVSSSARVVRASYRAVAPNDRHPEPA